MIIRSRIVGPTQRRAARAQFPISALYRLLTIDCPLGHDFLETESTSEAFRYIAGSGIGQSGVGNDIFAPAIDTTGANFLLLATALVPSGFTNTSVSDNYGNGWTLVLISGGNSFFYYAKPTSNQVGPNHIVKFHSNTGVALKTMFVAAFAGVDIDSGPVDRSNAHGASTVTTIASGSITPDVAPTAVFSLCSASIGAISSVDSGLTVIGSVASGSFTQALALAVKVDLDTASINPTWTATTAANLESITLNFYIKPLSPRYGEEFLLKFSADADPAAEVQAVEMYRQNSPDEAPSIGALVSDRLIGSEEVRSVRTDATSGNEFNLRATADPTNQVETVGRGVSDQVVLGDLTASARGDVSFPNTLASRQPVDQGLLDEVKSTELSRSTAVTETAAVERADPASCYGESIDKIGSDFFAPLGSLEQLSGDQPEQLESSSKLQVGPKTYGELSSREQLDSASLLESSGASTSDSRTADDVVFKESTDSAHSSENLFGRYSEQTTVGEALGRNSSDPATQIESKGSFRSDASGFDEFKAVGFTADSSSGSEVTEKQSAEAVAPGEFQARLAVDRTTPIELVPRLQSETAVLSDSKALGSIDGRVYDDSGILGFTADSRIVSEANLSQNYDPGIGVEPVAVQSIDPTTRVEAVGRPLARVQSFDESVSAETTDSRGYGDSVAVGSGDSAARGEWLRTESADANTQAEFTANPLSHTMLGDESVGSLTADFREFDENLQRGTTDSSAAAEGLHSTAVDPGTQAEIAGRLQVDPRHQLESGGIGAVSSRGLSEEPAVARTDSSASDESIVSIRYAPKLYEETIAQSIIQIDETAPIEFQAGSAADAKLWDESATTESVGKVLTDELIAQARQVDSPVLPEISATGRGDPSLGTEVQSSKRTDTLDSLETAGSTRVSSPTTNETTAKATVDAYGLGETKLLTASECVTLDETTVKENSDQVAGSEEINTARTVDSLVVSETPSAVRNTSKLDDETLVASVLQSDALTPAETLASSRETNKQVYAVDSQLRSDSTATNDIVAGESADSRNPEEGQLLALFVLRNADDGVSTAAVDRLIPQDNVSTFSVAAKPPDETISAEISDIRGSSETAIASRSIDSAILSEGSELVRNDNQSPVESRGQMVGDSGLPQDAVLRGSSDEVSAADSLSVATSDLGIIDESTRQTANDARLPDDVQTSAEVVVGEDYLQSETVSNIRQDLPEQWVNDGLIQSDKTLPREHHLVDAIDSRSFSEYLQVELTSKNISEELSLSVRESATIDAESATTSRSSSTVPDDGLSRGIVESCVDSDLIGKGTADNASPTESSTSGIVDRQSPAESVSNSTSTRRNFSESVSLGRVDSPALDESTQRAVVDSSATSDVAAIARGEFSEEVELRSTSAIDSSAGSETVAKRISDAASASEISGGVDVRLTSDYESTGAGRVASRAVDEAVLKGIIDGAAISDSTGKAASDSAAPGESLTGESVDRQTPAELVYNNRISARASSDSEAINRGSSPVNDEFAQNKVVDVPATLEFTGLAKEEFTDQFELSSSGSNGHIVVSEVSAKRSIDSSGLCESSAKVDVQDLHPQEAVSSHRTLFDEYLESAATIQANDVAVDETELTVTHLISDANLPIEVVGNTSIVSRILSGALSPIARAWRLLLETVKRIPTTEERLKVAAIDRNFSIPARAALVVAAITRNRDVSSIVRNFTVPAIERNYAVRQPKGS